MRIERFRGNDSGYLYLKVNEEIVNYIIPYEKLTDNNCVFINDIKYPEVGKLLIDNGKGYPTGYMGYDGYHLYPEYRINKEV